MATENFSIFNYIFEITANSQDIFWVRNESADKLLYVSPACEKILGQSCQSLYESPNLWVESIHPDDLAVAKEKIFSKDKYKTLPGKQNFSYRIIGPDGKIRWIDDCVFPLFKNKTLIGLAGIAKDITEFKLREQELLEIVDNIEAANQKKTHYLMKIQNASNASIDQVIGSDFFMQLAEKSEDVFWVRSSDYNIQLYVSPAYENIWGRTREELSVDPESWGKSLHPEDRDAVLNNLLDYKSHEFSIKYSSYRIVRPDGEIRWIKDTSFPITAIGGNCIGFAGIAKDVTQDHLRELALIEAKEHAEAVNQAKSDFLAIMSHELRTPLNGILGIAQILKRQNLSSTQQEYVSHILDAGFHLLSLLNDILDFSKLEAGKTTLSLAPLNLKELLQEIVGMMTPQAMLKKLDIQFKYNLAAPQNIIGDTKAIRQIVTNLIGNAIKFTEIGTVTIKVDSAPINASSAHFIIAVSDTGLGIPDDKLNVIFDRFQQVDSSESRKHGGTGLGLAISKSLIELMGGCVRAESILGKGSTFIWEIDFQLAEGMIEAEKNQATINSNATNNQKKPIILVVEDNPLNQKIAELMLQDLGCEVQLMDNGKQVLESDLSTYDLIFMDVGLPEMSGNEVVKKIRANTAYADLPIIALTAHAYEKNKEECLAAGMNDIINKPVIQTEMATTLTKWLHTDFKQEEI